MKRTLNHTRKRLLRWWITPVAGAIAVIAIGAPGAAPAAAPTVPANGIVCSNGATQADGSVLFKLTARDGNISTPDSNLLYMWGFAPGSGHFQYPGPNLCVTAGQTVRIVLKNTLPEATSIVFPGQAGVTADGVPSAPVYGTGGNLISLAPTAAAKTTTTAGGSITYSFTAAHAGTYIYESGTNQSKQLDMGLVGALVVRPAGNPKMAYDPTGNPSASTTFDPSTEYTMLLSQADPDLHHAVEYGLKYDMRKYHPQYWFINGRSFPDTIAPNGAPWLPSQPYGSLVQIQPQVPGASQNPDPALIRYLSTGPVTYPFHPHGNHGRVIGRDGRQLLGPGNQDLSYEKYTVAVGPGQTADAMYTWTTLFDPNDPQKQVPIQLPVLQNLLFKDNVTWSSGSIYLGQKNPLPVGVTSYNQCGENYFMMHSHALFQITNFGIAGGGMLTLLRVDPPGGCH